MQSSKTIFLVVAAIALVQAPQSANGAPQFNIFNPLGLTIGVSGPVLNASVATNVALDMAGAVAALTNLLKADTNLTLYANSSLGLIKFDLNSITALLNGGTATPAAIINLVQNATQVALNLAAAFAGLPPLAAGTSVNLTALFLNATNSLFGIATPAINAQLAASIGNASALLNTLIGIATDLNTNANTNLLALLTNLNTITGLANTGLNSIVTAKINALTSASNIIVNTLTTTPITAATLLNATSALIGVKVGLCTSLLNTMVTTTTGLTVPILASVTTVVNGFVAASNTVLTGASTIATGILTGTLNFVTALLSGK